MNFKIIKMCVLSLFCSNLVLAAEQCSSRQKLRGKTPAKHKETEDEMLDRLERENAPQLALPLKPNKKLIQRHEKL